jgi:hypothetical protein
MVHHRWTRQQLPGRHFTLIPAVVFVLCMGCAPLFDRSAQEDNIRESVFRYRMAESRSSGPFFLSIDGNDPSDAFMARFATSDRKVKKASESQYVKDPSPGWLRDRSTGEQGISFSADAISWLSSDRVEVRGGMYCGGLCADAGVYRIEKKQGRWVVIEYKIKVVS